MNTSKSHIATFLSAKSGVEKMQSQLDFSQDFEASLHRIAIPVWGNEQHRFTDLKTQASYLTGYARSKQVFCSDMG